MNSDRLILLSDLFGKTKAKWLPSYIEKLVPRFNVKFYDSCELAEIKNSNDRQEDLHRKFINGGIDKAVQNLLRLEKEKVNILAFSIGGTIAWKANLLGLDVQHFFAISSTRLRKENQIPNSKIKLYFGGQDMYQPDATWYDDKKVDHYIFKNAGHDLYTQEKYINQICEDLSRVPR